MHPTVADKSLNLSQIRSHVLFVNTMNGVILVSNDKSYYRFRAETEVEHAQQATHPAVVHAHYQLAEAYLEKLSKLEQPENERS